MPDVSPAEQVEQICKGVVAAILRGVIEPLLARVAELEATVRRYERSNRTPRAQPDARRPSELGCSPVTAEGTEQTVEAAAREAWRDRVRRNIRLGLGQPNAPEITAAAVTPLIRAAVVAECAQAIEAEAAKRKYGRAWLSHAAALVRALLTDNAPGWSSDGG